MSTKKPPSPTGNQMPPSRLRSAGAEIDAFVRQARAMAPSKNSSSSGRLILALDATLSRQPTWDLACSLQAEMFDAVGKKGGLSVQLVYFRGFGECRASRFVDDTTKLKELMTRINCRGGQTQIGKVLSHALKENQHGKVNAVVYIGDAVEEDIDLLANKAGRLGMLGVPVFAFQEGHDRAAEIALREIARLSKGGWFRFDSTSAAALAQLLSAVAVFATGGLEALEARGRDSDRLMLAYLRGGRP